MEDVRNSTAVAPLPVGTVFAKKYEILKALPSKEQRSYLCRRVTQPRQGELAVIKLLSQSGLGEHGETIAKRFQHEIVAAMSVRHPNIVRMDETIKEEGYFGYVVEYVEGQTLQTMLEDNRPSTVQVVQYLRQLCSALDAIHQAGMIHRNLKPKNIVVCGNDHLKITDFGLVKLIDQTGLTEAGMVLGTVDYLSPEYVMGGTADFQLDIYALGVIGYELLTDAPPFYSSNLAQMFTRRATMDPPSPLEVNRRCTAELAQVVLRAVQRDLVLRYRTAKDMLVDLEQLPGFEGVQIPKSEKAKPLAAADKPLVADPRPVITLTEPLVEKGEEKKSTGGFWRRKS